MVENARLTATIRSERGKGPARRLRAAGRIPAVIYGHGEQTRAVSVDARELEHLFARISVENTLIDLVVDGGGEGTIRTLVREVQIHSYRPLVLHVDFYQIHAGERVLVEVPIRLTGVAEGVRAGGLLQQALDDLSIRCVAEEIPEAIEVDVSALGIGDSIHVRDLELPAGVISEAEPDRTVCTVLAPVVVTIEEVPPEAPEGVGGEVEPELIRRRPAPGEVPPATEQG